MKPFSHSTNLEMDRKFFLLDINHYFIQISNEKYRDYFFSRKIYEILSKNEFVHTQCINCGKHRNYTFHEFQENIPYTRIGDYCIVFTCSDECKNAWKLAPDFNSLPNKVRGTL